MTKCARCCLHKSIQILNIFTNILGVGMIVYSLWLQKKWNQGVSELPSTAYLPKPWFIYTCLGVGITVCLSTVFGYMSANLFSNSFMCVYILTVCSLVSLEGASVGAIFFRMDWQMLILKFIDSDHKDFQIFLAFHVKICKLIAISVLVPQINVIALALILWGVGTQPRAESESNSDMSSIIQSFLESPNMPRPVAPTQTCDRCGRLSSENLNESVISNVNRMFRSRFQGTTIS